MRAPVSWLRELADVPADATGAEIAASLVKVGLEEEALHGGDISGPLVVGRVLEVTPEKQKNGEVLSKRVRIHESAPGMVGPIYPNHPPRLVKVLCGLRSFPRPDRRTRTRPTSCLRWT